MNRRLIKVSAPHPTPSGVNIWPGSHLTPWSPFPYGIYATSYIRLRTENGCGIRPIIIMRTRSQLTADKKSSLHTIRILDAFLCACIHGRVYVRECLCACGLYRMMSIV